MQSISRGRSRRVLGVLAVLAVCLGVAACGSSSKSSTTLTIGGWGGVIDEATQKAYLNQFDAENHLKSQFVDAPGVQLARVEAQNQAKQIQWDAVDSLDGGSAYTLYAKGQLAPLPASTKASFEKELGAQKVTPFGFSHGSLGDVIVCNTDKMKTCPSNDGAVLQHQGIPPSSGCSEGSSRSRRSPPPRWRRGCRLPRLPRRR